VSTEIQQYRIDVPDAVLDDLRDRLRRTRFPAAAPDGSWDYGAERGWLEDLVTYWAEKFDWRGHEERLNRWDHFTTTLRGEHIHFLHIRSPHPDAVPLIISHGWPGSVAEFVDIIDPLVDPVSHGGEERDAFDLVVPSLPGFGWSGPTTGRGIGPWVTAEMWAELMARLGYERYGAQGGDWGALITTNLGRIDPDHVIGIHLNMPSARPDPETMEDLRDDEKEALAAAKYYRDEDSGYFKQQSTRPQTVGYALEDSPAGLAAWIGEKFRTWTDCDGDVYRAVDREALLRNITIYWVTATAHSSARMYYEHVHHPGEESYVAVPTGVARFPREIFRPSRRWCEKAYDIRHWTEYARGGHFAAMEVPDLLVQDIRAFFRLVR
jgi:pimeloyl-ACP methyl ester carboxylesterase